jgi:hypothetical protein
MADIPPSILHQICIFDRKLSVKEKNVCTLYLGVRETKVKIPAASVAVYYQAHYLTSPSLSSSSLTTMRTEISTSQGHHKS